jgi:hypothetical protein
MLPLIKETYWEVVLYSVGKRYIDTMRWYKCHMSETLTEEEFLEKLKIEAKKRYSYQCETYEIYKCSIFRECVDTQFGN